MERDFQSTYFSLLRPFKNSKALIAKLSGPFQILAL